MTDIQNTLETLAHAPSDQAALIEVEEVYTHQGRWEELLRVYEAAARELEATLSVPLLHKAAKVCLIQLSSQPRALAYLQRAVAANPTNIEALRRLREIYLECGEYERGVEVFEKELARTKDSKQKAQGWLIVADLYRNQLNRVDKAVTAVKGAQRADASNPKVQRIAADVYLLQGRLESAHKALLTELELTGANSDINQRLVSLAQRLLDRPKLHDLALSAAEAVLAAGDNEDGQRIKKEIEAFRSGWTSRITELEQRATQLQTSSPEDAANTWLRVAEIQVVYGEQNEAALMCIDRALVASAGHSEALRLMEEIYGAADRWGELAMKLEMMAAYARDPDVAVGMYLKAAMHNTVRLDNPDAAARLYTRVLELVPGSKIATNALAEYYRERKQWDDALQVLRVWADRATSATDKVAAHYACCRILDEDLNDPVKARPHYEAILDLDSENQAAARALEKVYRQAGDHGALCRVLLAKLAGQRGSARIDVLRELGDLFADHVDDATHAFEVLGELYQIEPSPDLRERLEELAAKTNDFLSLVSIFEGGLGKIVSETEKVDAMHSMASLYEGAREAPREAMRIHRRILAIKSDDVRSTEAVARLLEVAAQAGDKLAFYREQADAVSNDEERVSILHKLAHEHVETAKDYVRGIDVYHEILKLIPTDGAAKEGLLSLYRRDNRWAEVADLLNQKLKLLPPSGDERMSVELELAAIFEQHLAQIDQAVEHYAHVLDIDGGNTLAYVGLERLIARTKKVRLAAEHLQSYYSNKGDWARAADMCEIRVRGADDLAARVELLRELAGMYDKELHQPADAMAALLRAFQADPSETVVREDLERIASATGDFTQVIRSYRAAGLALDDHARRELVLRAGGLAEQQRDLPGACRDYLRAMDGSDQGFTEGVAGLRRLMSLGVTGEQIIEAARAAVAVLDDAPRAAVWRKLAEFCEKDLESSKNAIEAWNAVLEAAPGDQGAIKAVDRLYNESSDPTDLVAHLRDKMQQASNDADRAALGLQIAEVLANRLNDVEGAIAQLVEVSALVPGQGIVWERLAQLQRQAGRPKEAAEAMHRQINLLAQGDERHGALVAYAEILGTEINDQPGALGALQSVLAADPKHDAAIALIERMYPAITDAALRASLGALLLTSYRTMERWDDWVTLMAARIELIQEPVAKLDAVREMAGIKLEQLQDAPGAFNDLNTLFREQPANQALRVDLERATQAANAWPQLADTYQAALGVMDDAAASSAVRRRLAEILDQKLGRGSEAVAYYKTEGGDEIPQDLASLEAMERLLREQNNQAELAEVLAAKLGHVDETPGRAAIYAELGQICEQVLVDKPRAMEVYKGWGEVDPKNPDPLHHLDRLLVDLNQLAEREPILQALVALSGGNPQLVDDMIALAGIEVLQKKYTEAFEHYRGVLLKKREHEGAVAGLEDLISKADNKIEISKILEPVYNAKQDHEKLAWVLEQCIDATEDAVKRKGLIRRIGDIYENRLGNKERAFAMARRSLAADASDMGVRMWIEKLAGETGAHRELATAYVEEAQKAEPPTNLQFHRRAAALFQEKLNDPGAATEQFKSILAIDARDEKSLMGLDTIFRASESYKELVDVLRQRVALAAGIERKREMLNEIGQLQSERLSDFQGAVATYRDILEASPDDVAAFAQVERLLAQSGSWEELSQTYEAMERRLAQKRGRDVAVRRIEYMYRRGRIADEQFGDHEQAAQIFEAALEEDPTQGSLHAYLPARVQQGVLAFVRLLEKVYSDAEQWQNFVGLLEVKLQHLAETDLRRGVYLQLATAYDEKLNAGDMAFQSLMRGFNENRADLDLLERLEVLAEKYGSWEELVQVLGVDLDAIPDPQLRIALLRKLGDICGTRIGDSQRAIGYLNAALQYAPSDAATLDALDGVLEASEMWAALADILERRVGLVSEASEKSIFLERLATVWGEKLMDAEAALRCHQQIMEIDPDHPISLRQMQKLYAEVQDWDALAKNLARQADVFEDEAEQIRIHTAAGTLYVEELNDTDAAIESWLRVAKLDPVHEEAAGALDVLLTTEERWEELADVLKVRLAHTQNPDDKLDINRRLGVIFGDRLDQGDEALTNWLDVLERDPKHTDAMRALLELYSQRAMWTEFVDIAGRLTPLSDPAEAKQIKFRWAEALGENLGEREAAIKLAREVRAQEPHTVEEMTALGQMLSNIEAYDEAVIALEKAGALHDDPGTQVALFYQAADIYDQHLDRPNDARPAYEAILAINGGDSGAFTRLAEVYRCTEEWRTLVALNEDFLPHAEDSGRLKILIEIRDVQDQKLGEKEMAFIAACRVYKENASDQEAAEILERIALQSDGAEEAAAVLEDEIESITDSVVQVETYRRVARLYAEELQDTHAAEATLQKILTIDASNLAALDEMAKLGAQEERYDKQIAALEGKLAQVEEDTERKGVLFDIARIWEDRIGEPDEAIVAYNRILEIDGGDHPTLEALVRIYEVQGHFNELAHVLTRQVELAQDPTDNAALRMRVGQLCERELSNPEAAIQWYRGVFDLDAQHAGALGALDRLYTGLERWSELVQIFEMQVGQAPDAEGQITILSKMATIYETEFSSPADARQCYERCFALDTQHLITLKNLERLLRVLGEWNRLIEILEHHVSLVEDTDEITQLQLQVGEIYYKELSRVDKAEEVYSQARNLNPNSDAALHALGQLYERSGNWFQSLEMMQHEAEALGMDPASLSVLMRIGRINDDILGDQSSAKAAYQRALAIDPTYAPALAAMKEIAKGSENWDAYVEHLLTEAETTTDDEDKTDLFIEAAEFYANTMEDEASAIRYFGRAIEVTPGHFEASKQLAEIYFRHELWEEAGELYEVVVQALDKSTDAKEYCQKYYRLGYINEKLGEKEKSLGHYQQAFEADATYLPALEGLGQALLNVDQWEDAHKVFQTILIHHRDALTESEVVDVQAQLGEICMAQGQPDRAYKQFEKALEIDSDHPQSLSLLATLDVQMENWESALARLNRLGDVAPGPQRVDALLRASHIATDQLKDMARGVEPLERARKLGQATPDILGRLADLYIQTRQAQKAVDTLEEAKTKEEDAEKRSAIELRLGFLLETEIKHEPMAVQCYNAALDAMPTNFQAFEAIERILGGRQEWALLEANYRAMIARAKDLAPNVRITLWRNLAELYRKVLDNVDSAIMAYEVLAKLDQGNVEDKLVLGELYTQKPEKCALAIEMQHDLVPQLENPVAAIRTLRKLYHASHDFDAVYNLCCALAFMNAADGEENQIREHLAQGVPSRATGVMREEQWRVLLHPGLDCTIGQAAMTLFKMAQDVFFMPTKSFGLKKKDHVDLRQSDLFFANLVRYSGKVLNLPGVELYTKAGSVEPVHVVNTRPPAVVVGQSNDLHINPAHTRVALFFLGRNIAYLRPELFLARMYPGEAFRDLLLGLCMVYNTQLEHAGNPTAVQNWAKAFALIPQQGLRRLQPLIKQLFADISSVAPLQAYMAAVELSAMRAGLTTCGDIGAAHVGVNEGGEGASTLPVRERAKELVMFSVSKPYFDIRKSIGAALVIQQQGT